MPGTDWKSGGAPNYERSDKLRLKRLAKYLARKEEKARLRGKVVWPYTKGTYVKAENREDQQE